MLRRSPAVADFTAPDGRFPMMQYQTRTHGGDQSPAPPDAVPAETDVRAAQLCFRWVKQTLRIRRFIGTSENAVCIQIAVALIAFLLLRLAQPVAGLDDESPLQFARPVIANLMHRKTLRQLFGAEPDPPLPGRRPPGSASMGVKINRTAVRQAQP